MLTVYGVRDFPGERSLPPPRPRHCIGLDLGQLSDPSALVLLRWQKLPNAKPVYELATLQRWPLGTSYTAIVEGLARFYRTDELRVSPPLLVVDATGVGNAVCEMIPAHMRQAKVSGNMLSVTITGGSAVTNVVGPPGRWNVAKKQLASILQVLLGNRRLHVGEQPETATLMRELSNFQVKISAAGNESFESWRERDHDDLVLALALAAWAAETLPRLWDPPPVLPRRLVA
jgi:hypothetical protein